MTGQVVAAVILAALIVAVVPWLMLRDLRRAAKGSSAYRNMLDRLRQVGVEVIESPYVPEGTFYLLPRIEDYDPGPLFMPFLYEPPDHTYQFRVEQHMALSVTPPQVAKIVTAP